MAKKKTAKKKATKKEAPKKSFLTANKELVVQGIRRPQGGGASQTVWEIADELSNQARSFATYKEVLDECSIAGIDSNIAKKQFARWDRYSRNQ